MVNLFKKSFPVALILLLAAAILVTMVFPLGAVFSASAQETYGGDMIFEQVVVSTADEAEAGVYRSIAAGDTFTVTYKLVKNDGFVEGWFTPAYDKEVFELTSVSVDSNNWTLFEDYGGAVLDEQTNQLRPMTAQEYLTDCNQKYDAGEIEDFRFTAEIRFADVRDANGTLSDHFMTLVYTARVDLVAPLTGDTDFGFGFDTSLDGFYTNAAMSGEALLDLRIKTGMDGDEILSEPISEDMYAFSVIAELDVTLAEDQTINFRYDETSSSYVLDLDDIALTFNVGDKAAYLADGGEIIYTFYMMNDQQQLVPITDNDGLPAVPNLTDVYVCATLPATEHFEGATSGDPVHIAIAPTYVDLPDLRLYDSMHGDSAFVYDNLYRIYDTVTYGTTFDLKQVVNDEEVPFAFPEAGESVLGDLVFSYARFVGGSSSGSVYENNPLAEDLLAVDTYRVVIRTADPVYVSFETESGELLSTLSIEVTVTKATLTLNAFVRGESSVNLVYGDAAPEASEFTYEAVGAFETGDALATLLGSLNVQISSLNPYHQFDDVGTYTYYAAAPSLANYTVNAGTPANLIVAAKPLTLSVEYEGGVATLRVGGIVNDDDVTPTYYVADVALAGTTYSATAEDYTLYVNGGALTAKVTPDAGSANYAEGTTTLACVYKVSFLPGEDFADAQEMPQDQYVFEGAHASLPAAPTYNNFSFLYWTLSGEEYVFTEEEVTEDVTLVAEWEKMIFSYKFRAIYATAADLLGNGSYALAWNDEAGKFAIQKTTLDDKVVAAATAPAASFTKGTVIPSAIDVGGFYLARWYKVVPQQVGDPLKTEEVLFDPQGSYENNEGAYYLAVMAIDIGAGDVNGDGYVSTNDLLSIRKFFTGTSATVINSEKQAWEAVLRTEPAGGYFYLPMWDVNGDGARDSRDIVTLREALATGYGYEIVQNTTADGVYCHGEQIAADSAAQYEGQVAFVSDVEGLDEQLSAGNGVILTQNIELEATVVDYEGDVFIDLAGHTITTDYLSLTSSGSITVKNGMLDVGELELISQDGVTLVNVTDGTGYDVSTDGTDPAVGWSA